MIQTAHTIPREMIDAPRWVLWKATGDDARKIPHNAKDGSRASSTDPRTWCDYSTARQRYESEPGQWSGLGFVLGDGFAGVDLDNCITDGELHPAAAEIVRRLDSYAEVSPSGDGVKVFTLGSKPDGKCKTAETPWNDDIEIYGGKRYFTVTGDRLDGAPDALRDCTDTLAEIHAEHFPQPKRAPSANGHSNGRVGSADADAVRRCVAHINTLPNAVSGQGGHDRTFQYACECARYGLNENQTRAVMEWANTTKCEPPWTDRELQHKIDSARERVIARGEFGIRLHESPRLRIAGTVADPAPAPSATPGEARDNTQGGSVARRLVALALETHTLHTDEQGAPFALRIGGPRVALPLSGSFSDSLARAYFTTHGAVANASAMADTLSVLRAMAGDGERCEVNIRCARDGGRVVLDLARPDGAAMVIDADGWRVTDSPVIFRRTKLTGELPDPERGGDIGELWELLNIAEADRDLLLGWLVSALIADIPCPVAMLSGQQGTGKTTAARIVAGIFDPSPAPTRSAPRDIGDWAVACSGSWCVTLDNISGLSPWLQDALCCGVTGAGMVKRALYTDDGLNVLAFRRRFILTTIDSGALRGDLAERLVMLELDRIDPANRRTEAEIVAAVDSARARILGALLDALSATLAALPTIQTRELPRMADFARLLAAMDSALGTGALARYGGQADRIAADVVEGDAVAVRVVELARQSIGWWEGPAGELLHQITPDPAPRGWPSSPHALGGHLRRIIPALSAMGVEVIPPRQGDKGRKWAISPIKGG